MTALTFITEYPTVFNSPTLNKTAMSAVFRLHGSVNSHAQEHWMLLGWGTVSGARLTHAWRYHPRHHLLQSFCRDVLRYGPAFELLQSETEQRCKICMKRGQYEH